jgi:hypothetical protein
MNRMDEELRLLRHRFADLEFHSDGQWVRLPTFRLPAEIWEPDLVEVAFQIPTEVGVRPYGFYVRPHANSDGGRPALRLASGRDILNYTFPANTAWGSDWGLFSHELEVWRPGNPIEQGSSMLDFARSFMGRLVEGA